MQHFDAANRLRHRTSKLDRAPAHGAVRRPDRRASPRSISPAMPALGCDDETPLLVLGMPRSGTTLTEQIVSSHPAVVGGGELPFLAGGRRRRGTLAGCAA